jgi:diguanylate cyclase (GGDEF)-like protein/PAS domain S-box-containing protein
VTDKSENLKIRILVPMILVGAILIVVSLSGGYRLQKNAIDNSVQQRVSGVQLLFKELLREESQVMSGQIDFIKTDQSLLASFLSRDRTGLAVKAQPLFRRMRSKYRITHFYFHGTDKICFLRVHSPDRYGDRIDRVTLAEAVSTGKPFYGIELGPLGTFTLRVVHPWVVEGRLEGYIELGMEIEHITQLIKQAHNLELIVLIEKKFLKKEDWEDGQKMLNRRGNWDQYEDFVITDRTMEDSPVLNDKIGEHHKDDESIFSVDFGGRRYKEMFRDLIDAGNHRVGKIVSLVDVTAQQANLARLIFLMAGLSLTIGCALLLFFNNYIGKIQNRLVTSSTKLREEIKIRRQSEEALAASEKRFRSIYEESKDAIISTDLKGKFLMVNPAGIELLGMEGSDLGSNNIRDLYVDPAMARRFSSTIRDQGYVRDLGVQLFGKGRKIIDCFITATTKQSDDGTLIGYEGIVRDVTPYKKMEDELRRLATIDFLTGVNNRRNFLDLAQKEINRSKRYGHHFSLAMLDIDHFKKVNDTFGHSVGDQVLIEFCDVCRKVIRENDIMGRLGGEEFAVALVESDTETVLAVAERIRNAVASHSVIVGNREIRFTVSLGVTWMWPDCDLKSMLEHADNALYQAKENGRNQVMTSRIDSAIKSDCMIHQNDCGR